jgi:anthranilate synthase component 1
VVHAREFLADSLTPLAVYRRLEELSPVRFLLESVTGGEQVSRYSFLGAAPRALYRLHAHGLEVEEGG